MEQTASGYGAAIIKKREPRTKMLLASERWILSGINLWFMRVPEWRTPIIRNARELLILTLGPSIVLALLLLLEMFMWMPRINGMSPRNGFQMLIYRKSWENGESRRLPWTGWSPRPTPKNNFTLFHVTTSNGAVLPLFKKKTHNLYWYKLYYSSSLRSVRFRKRFPAAPSINYALCATAMKSGRLFEQAIRRGLFYSGDSSLLSTVRTANCEMKQRRVFRVI